MAISQVYGGILRGAGDTMTTMYISIITTVIIRVPLAYGLAALNRSEAWPHGHPDALFFSLLVSWVIGAVLKASLLTSVVLVASLILFGRYLIMMFTDTPEIISLGVRSLRILAVGYIAMAVSQVYGGILRGAGDTMTTMYISLITTVIIRVPLAYGIAFLNRSEAWPHGHPDALFISLLVSWVIGAVLTYIWYRMGKWKNIKLVD